MEHAIEAGAEDVSKNEKENTLEVIFTYFSFSKIIYIDALSSSLMLEMCSWSRLSYRSLVTK